MELHNNQECAICMEYENYTHHCPRISQYRDALGALAQANIMTPSLLDSLTLNAYLCHSPRNFTSYHNSILTFSECGHSTSIANHWSLNSDMLCVMDLWSSIVDITLCSNMWYAMSSRTQNYGMMDLERPIDDLRYRRSLVSDFYDLRCFLSPKPSICGIWNSKLRYFPLFCKFWRVNFNLI